MSVTVSGGQRDRDFEDQRRGMEGLQLCAILSYNIADS